MGTSNGIVRGVVSKLEFERMLWTLSLTHEKEFSEVASKELLSLSNPNGSELDVVDERVCADDELVVFVEEEEVEEYGWTGAKNTCEHIILVGCCNQWTLKPVPLNDIATDPNIISPKLL